MSTLCACGLEKGCKHPRLAYEGPKTPQILVVGGYPDASEDESGHIFTSSGGTLLRRILSESGVDVCADVGFVNVLGCHVPEDSSPSPEQKKACAPNLLQVLAQTKDTVGLVFLLGNYPLRQLLNKTGITKWHGKSTYIGEVIYHPCYDPAYCLQYPDTIDALVQDVQAGLRLLEQPVRDLIPFVEADSGYLKEYLDEILTPDQYLAYDCETNGLDPFADDACIVGVSLCWSGKASCFVPLEHPERTIPASEWNERIRLLKQILESPAPKVGHNSKFDRQFLLMCLGIRVQNDVCDTMLDHHLLDERKGTHRLTDLVPRYIPDYAGYDSRMALLMEMHDAFMPNIPIEDIVFYASGDAYVTRELALVFEKALHEEGLFTLSREHVLPANLVYTEMEISGVKWDLQRAEVLRRDYLQMIEKMQEAIWALPIAEEWLELSLVELEVSKLEANLVAFQQTGKNAKGYQFTEYQEKNLIKKIVRLKEEAVLNPNAHLQIQRILYDICGLPEMINKQSGNRSSDKEARKALLELPANTELERKGHALLKALNYHSRVTKLSSGYTAEYRKHIHDDGLVHTHFNQQGTVTGRLSSSSPNVQQIPRNLYPGENPDPEQVWLSEHNIKSMFISKFEDEGYVVNADYSQLELRLMACLSGDAIMVQAYNDGIDLHTLSAKLLNPGFDDMDEDTRKNLRREAKTWNFASAYSFQKEFLEMYPGLGVWVQKMQDHAKDNLTMTNAFGRKRRLPELGWARGDFGALNHALRQAVNFMIQSTGHELLMRAIVKVDKALKAEGLRSHLMMEVHDSIMVDCWKPELDIVIRVLYEQMSDMSGLDWVTIPITAEASYGPSWADQTEIEYEPA